MQGVFRATTLTVALTLALTACASAERLAASEATTLPDPPAPPTAVPSAAPTVTPQPTAVPALASDVRIAGVDVSGLSPAEARQKLERELAPVLRPLEIEAGEAATAIKAEDVELALPLDELIAKAQAAGAGARIALEVRYNTDKLKSALQALAQQTARPPTVSLISDTETLSRSFVLEPGPMLDVAAALKQIDERWRAPGSPRRVTLPLVPDTQTVVRPSPEQLQQQIEEMAKQWKGVVGLYVYDLNSGQVQASLNERTVFSAASTIKTAIMLNTYINLADFTEEQKTWLRKMIVESDNLAANSLLAAAAGGRGTEDALAGAEKMSQMLADLGLPHTYLYVPFEATDYIKLRNLKVKQGPKQDGAPPYTESGRYLRSTPAEMAQLYIYLEQCAHGKGPLLERFERLTVQRCQEMLTWLEQNDDDTRMVAGLPAGTRVAHKSGWVDDVQSDVGIVRSPGGDYVVAIYIYRPLAPGKVSPDRLLRATIAGFSHLVYSYYNPAVKR